MEIKDLETRIEKKLADIEKVNRRIKKWQDAKTEKGFWKEKEWLVHNYLYNNPDKTRDDFFNRWYPDYIKNCDDEIRRAERDLKDQQTTLQKYQNQLALMKAKEERSATTEKIPVIVEFLENWKQEVIKDVEENTQFVDEYYRLNHEYCDLYNSRWSIIKSGEMTKEELDQKLKDIDKREKRAKQAIFSLTEMTYSHRTGKINYDRLNEILDKDIEAKYWTMIDRVTEITGEITDASRLRVAGDGNLNGIIIGTDGKAKLETVLAGGYNQGIIVNVKHGQILHYRLLVHEVK